MIPKTLDELLTHLPTLRKLRSINADLLRLMLGRENRECTWCGKVVPKGCRTWCSDACVKLFKIRCDPGTAAGFVAQRDRFICQICGFDCSSRRGSANYEIDHIIPVCEGGGLCDTDNLRLLCRMCHQRQTTMLASRLSGKRRPRQQWIRDTCDSPGCDGFDFFVYKNGKNRFRITCQICGKNRIVDQPYVDAAVAKFMERKHDS